MFKLLLFIYLGLIHTEYIDKVPVEHYYQYYCFIPIVDIAENPTKEYIKDYSFSSSPKDSWINLTITNNAVNRTLRGCVRLGAF